MNYVLRIRPAADADVDDAARFIAQDNFDAALHCYDAVDQSYRQIRDHPHRWPRYELDHPQLAALRKRAVVGFRNHLIFYLTEDTSVQVIRVLHDARDIPAVLAADLIEE